MDDDGYGFVIWFLVAAGIVVWWGWNDDGWIGRQRYAWSYKVPSNYVQFSPKPYDCDWGTAPIGAKHCSYVPVVSAYNAARTLLWQDGKPMVAEELIYKNGKIVVSHGDVVSVEVGWTRVTD